MYNMSRIYTDAADVSITNPEKVTYYLYIRVGFETLLLGDRVRVIAIVPTPTEAQNDMAPSKLVST